MKIDRKFAVTILIEILFEKGLVNEATYRNALQYEKMQYNEKNLHISQAA